MTRIVSRAALLGALAGSVLLAAAPAHADSPGFITPAHVPYYVTPPGISAAPGLAALAQQLLGQSSGSGQILSLNQGRTQPGGGALTASGDVLSGWYLVLPCNATGSFEGSAVQWNPPPFDVPPHQVAESCPANLGTPARPVPAVVAAAPGSQAGQPGGPASSDDSLLIWLSVVALVLASCGVAALVNPRIRRRVVSVAAHRGTHRARTRARSRRSHAHKELLGAPETVDTAVSALDAVGRDSTWWPYAAVVSPHSVTVWLAGLNIPEPPEPWRAVPGDPRAWNTTRAECAELSGAAPDSEVCPVVLGVTDDSVVVLDVSQAYGMLTIRGDAQRAESVRTAVADQLEGGEVLLHTSEADPAVGRAHWSIEVDGDGWISVHGRSFAFAELPAFGPAPRQAQVPQAAEPAAPAAPALANIAVADDGAAGEPDAVESDPTEPERVLVADANVPLWENAAVSSDIAH